MTDVELLGLMIRRATALAAYQDPGPHPHLQVRALPAELQGLVGQRVHAALQERDRKRAAGEPGGALTGAEVYLNILEVLGIDCPHAWEVHRTFSDEEFYEWLAGKRHGRLPREWLECTLCGVWEVPVR